MSERDTTSEEKTKVEPVEAALPARRPALPSVPRPSPIGTEPVAIEHSRRRPTVRSIIAIAVIAIGAVAVGQWLFTPTTVTVTSPTRGPAVQAVFATGSVEATVMVPLAGRITARLVQLNADEGDAVTKGQVLARFEDRDVQSAFAQAQAQEQFAKGEYDRTAKLLQTGAVTKAAYDKAYSDWQAAVSAAQKASAEAEFLTLTAPADGTIVKRDGELGQLIPANQTIFWLAQNQPLRITADVDEEDIGLVRVGQDVLIRADAYPGKVFHGHVQSITPMGDPVARSYRVRIQLAEDTPLLIGMTAETNIVVAEHQNALLVPAAAVVGDKVWRVANSRLTQQAVSIGIKGTDKIEILSGLSDHDQIVANANGSFTVGQRVRPVREAAN